MSDKSSPDIFSTPQSAVELRGSKPDNPLLSTASYGYDLPESSIAMVPLSDRAASKMLLLDKLTGEYKDESFRNIIFYLNRGDLIVVNNTKVIPARLFCRLSGSIDESVYEILLVRPEGDKWVTMLSDQGAKLGNRYTVIYNDDTSGGAVDRTEASFVIIESREDDSFVIEFNGDAWSIIDAAGKTPLPPYIRNHEQLEKDGIKDRYNTVYAKEMTSVAAPTAGLHFTDGILAELDAGGVQFAEVSLDVGLGTFRPVETADIREHHMHTEHIRVTAEVIEKINATKAAGHKVVCIGTTSMRTLESVPDDVWDNPRDFESDTSIFIYPGGRQIRVADALFTNFHAPESTLMMLVSAFAGYDSIMSAYKHAVESGYRFLSLGDCMFIKEL